VIRLSGDEIVRVRLRAQLLAGAPERRGVAETVSVLVGVQAQDETAAALAVRARTRGLVDTDVHRAVAEDRSLTLTWSLRGTRHVHGNDDVRWIVGLLGPVVGTFRRRENELGIGGAVGERAVRVVREALAKDGPLTRPQIKERLASIGIDTRGQAPIHVLRRAALQGVLCVVPGPIVGGERYVLMDDQIPRTSPMEPERAAAELVRRYLVAHGPATPRDFAAWSGLRTGMCAAAWEAVAEELTEVDGPGEARWVLSRGRGTVVSAPRTPAPIRLLGGFDPLLLGYRDRGLHLAPAHARDVNAGGGLIRPIVVSDGRVIGTWRQRRGRPTTESDVTPFRRLTSEERGSIERELLDVNRFLGTEDAPRPRGRGGRADRR
jgi:hypothetical protein